MKNILRCIIILIVVMSGSVCAQIQDWPMLYGNKEQTAWARLEDTLQPPLEEEKILVVQGLVNVSYHEMTWFDYTLCVGIQRGTGVENLFAMFDTNAGNTLWTFAVPSSESGVYFAPAQNDTLVFIGGQKGLGLYARDRLTGLQSWFHPMPNPFCRHPVLDGDRLYIVGDQLKCLNVADGSVIWDVPFNANVSLAVGDNNCYVCGNYQTVCYHKMNGTKIWSRYNSHLHYHCPVLYGGYLYTHTSDSVIAYEKNTGNIHWVYETGVTYIGNNARSFLAVSDSVICCNVWNNVDKYSRLLALNRADGSYHWHFDFENSIYTPVIANGVVYAVQEGVRDLYAFDLKTGTLLMRNDDHLYSFYPIVANHRLYVGTWDEGVVVFKNGSGTAVQSVQSTDAFQLQTNYPNPFNPSTRITYSLPRPAQVELTIYNLQGQMIKTLFNGFQTSGTQAVMWDGRDEQDQKMVSGQYIYRIEAGEYNKSGKMMLTR